MTRHQRTERSLVLDGSKVVAPNLISRDFRLGVASRVAGRREVADECSRESRNDEPRQFEPTSAELACQCRPILTYVVVDTGRSSRSRAVGGTTSLGIASKFVDKHEVTHLGDCESCSDCWMGVQWACG